MRVFLRPLFALFVVVVLVIGTFPVGVYGAAPQPKPSPIAAVVQVTIIPASRAAIVVHELFPHVNVRVDSHANAVVLYGSPDDVQSARSVITGIDVKNPTTPTIDIVAVHVMKPQDIWLEVTRIQSREP